MPIIINQTQDTKLYINYYLRHGKGCTIGDLLLGGGILDEVFLLSYTFLSDFSIVFYFDHQEK